MLSATFLNLVLFTWFFSLLIRYSLWFKLEITPPFSLIWVDQFSFSFIVTPRSLDDFSWMIVFPPTVISTGVSVLVLVMYVCIYLNYVSPNNKSVLYNLSTVYAKKHSQTFTILITFFIFHFFPRKGESFFCTSTSYPKEVTATIEKITETKQKTMLGSF